MVFLISSAWELVKPSLVGGDEVGVKYKLMITLFLLAPHPRTRNTSNEKVALGPVQTHTQVHEKGSGDTESNSGWSLAWGPAC